MADEVFTTKRGDRATAILVQLKRGDGSIVDLTGKLLSDIKFIFRNLSTGAVTSGNAAAIVGPATDGKVRYDPTATDVAVVAEKQVEVELTQSPGVTETFPVCDRFLWRIVADLG